MMLLGTSLYSTDEAGEKTAATKIAVVIESLRTNMPPFTLGNTSDRRVGEYLSYYQLDFPAIRHSFGGITVADETIAVHVFRPVNPRATVVISHGYFDHTGIWRHAIQSLLTNNFCVLVYDYPGHGLSSGSVADIKTFKQYRDVLQFFEHFACEYLPGPVHLVGHSMGAGILAEHILKNGLAADRRAVLFAPNIRSEMWGLSKFGNALVRPFAKRIKRSHRRSSHNKQFLAFRSKQDPLQARYIPVNWFVQLVKWSQEMETLKPRAAVRVRAIQGTKDGTVDWRYNIPFLEKKLMGLDVVKIKGAEHQLINETDQMRTDALRQMINFLVD